MSYTKSQKNIVVVAGKRTPFARAGTSLCQFSSIDLALPPVNALSDQFQLQNRTDGLFIFGTVIPHSDVSSIAREVVLESKLHPQTKSISSVLACATSLNCVAEAVHWMQMHDLPWSLAGGVESMSNFPVNFSKNIENSLRDLKFSKTKTQKLNALLKLRPSHFLPQTPPIAERSTGLTMGEHCELMVKEWKIPRIDQDQLAVQSHLNAAQNKKWHEQFIVAPKGSPNLDNLVRTDTTLEKMKKLKPAFTQDGTITAANATPLTDGAAVVLLAEEEFAKKNNWPILAKIEDFEMAAVDIRNEGLLMAPSYALLRLLKRNSKKLSDFDVIEIHEAFAAQVLCNLQAIGSSDWAQKKVGLQATTVPRLESINKMGGSIALGHPFGATGARLVMQTAQQIYDNKKSSGIISICAAGGLGFTMILKQI